MDRFWVDTWLHIIFPEKVGGSDRLPIISQLCFGPLETREYGIADGKFYFEEHIIEGVCEGECDFCVIGKEEFLRVIDNEIKLCEKYAPPLAGRLSEALDKLRGGK